MSENLNKNCGVETRQEVKRDVDSEYLSRGLVAGVQYCISEDRVAIASPSTLFVNLAHYVPRTQKALLEGYSNLLNTAKAHSVRVVYANNYKKSILAAWDAYTLDCKQAEAIWKSLKVCAEKVRARGIHYGFSDDAVVAELTKLAGEYQACFYRDTTISKIETCIAHFSSLLEFCSDCTPADRATINL